LNRPVWLSNGATNKYKGIEEAQALSEILFPENAQKSPFVEYTS